MSKSRKPKHKAKPPAKGKVPWGAVVTLAIAVLAALGFWWTNGRSGDTPATAALTAGVNPTNPPAADAAANSEFLRLKGKWVRPDGGYVVDIRNVDASGKLDAAYLNPRPIHVAKAQASQDGAAVRVFIELQDVNYPGSTYTLAYNAASDQLAGVYYQAALQQKFEVVFERIK